MSQVASFSFEEIMKHHEIILPKPSFITTSDGLNLAYYPFLASNPVAVFLFIHGAGACSGAGYQYLAHGLSKKYNISTYLLDLRGHGNSGGPRGDTPTPEHVLEDLNRMIVLIENENPHLPSYLGGHSSGSGLVLNYLHWNQARKCNGYFFIAPFFGYQAKHERKNNPHPFAKADLAKIIFNHISRGNLFGNTPVIRMNYPDQIIKHNPLLITSMTCNMSKALTPNNPQKLFAAIPKPYGLFIGENDELFEPQKVIQYAKLPPDNIQFKSHSGIIKNAKHLSILKEIDSFIGEAIIEMNRYQ
ncbi:MAG TPA: lysophospholipase [Firmicutes bacterium]|jgi:acylglycerol lipase|nr:lysophospholipase [Bacillota bacterium]